MRRLFWIGSPFFWQSLREAGWDEVAFCNFEEPRVLGWQDVVRQAGFVPDVLNSKIYDEVFPVTNEEAFAASLDYFRGDELVVINKQPTPADHSATLVLNQPIGQALGGEEGGQPS